MPSVPGDRPAGERWRRSLGGLILGTLAAWALSGCLAAPTPHPEEDATLAGGASQDAAVDAGRGDWGNAAQPPGDADAAAAGLDAAELVGDAEGLQDAVEPSADVLGEADGLRLDGVEGDVEGDDVGPADAGDADALGEQGGREGS